jgi:hypothetical protein
MRGERGSCGVSANEYIINFGDLTPYLTYMDPCMKCRFFVECLIPVEVLEATKKNILSN